MFLFQAEADLFMRALRDPRDVVHPFTLLPVLGQAMLASTVAGCGRITELVKTAARPAAAKAGGVGQTPMGTYAQDFDDMAHLQGKSLLILMVPAFAVGAWTLNRRARRYYVEHLIFSFHFYALLLLAMAASTMLTQLFLSAAASVGYRFSYVVIESTSSGILLLVLGGYLFSSLRRLFRRSAMLTGLQTVILLGWSVVVLSAYRFVLFLTTFAAT